MGSSVNRSSVDEAARPDTSCGNPCHPGHVCSACAPFWNAMLETGRFKAYVPPTFEGGTPSQEPNFFDRNVDLAGLKSRSRSSRS